MGRRDRGGDLNEKRRRDRILGERAKIRKGRKEARWDVYVMYGEYLANIRKPFPQELIDAELKKRKGSGV